MDDSERRRQLATTIKDQERELARGHLIDHERFVAASLDAPVAGPSGGAMAWGELIPHTDGPVQTTWAPPRRCPIHDAFVVVSPSGATVCRKCDQERLAEGRRRAKVPARAMGRDAGCVHGDEARVAAPSRQTYCRECNKTRARARRLRRYRSGRRAVAADARSERPDGS